MLNGRWSFLKNPWAVTGIFLSLIVVSGLGIFAWQVAGFMREIKAGEDNPYEKRRLEASVTDFLEQKSLDNLDLTRIESGGADPELGNPVAPIKIVEFLDYQCPYSKRSAGAIRNFVARHSNDILLVLRDYPLENINERAMDASIAARCVFAQKDPNKFWRYHDLLFANQEALEAEDLKAYARTINVDMVAFNGCFNSREPEKLIRKSIEDGTAAGVRGTPTFYINKLRAPGALDEEIFEVIFKQLKGKV